MADRMVTRARARLEQVNKQLSELKAEAIELEAYLKVSDRLRAAESFEHIDAILNAPEKPKRARGVQQAVTQAAVSLLADGKRKKTEQLLEEISLITEVPGTNKRARLAQMLSRDNRFISDRKLGWSLSATIHALAAA